MGYIELSTKEFATIIDIFIKKSAVIDNNISNLKGIHNGFSFDFTHDKLFLRKYVPLKIIFNNFDENNNILVLGIALNSENIIYQNIANKVLTLVSGLINMKLSEFGCEIRENLLYFDTNTIAHQTIINSIFTDIKIESSKLSISFELRD
jgi:hypothetical protein